ncbi:MAG TPA: hypothetical protein VGH33_00185 [Isosphaeraceae bacterium]|jgi:hypothetical protein
MADRIVEGSWEEIARRGPEFAGCRVRVTVLDEPSPSVTLDRVLAPLLDEAETLSRQLPAANGATSPDAWGDAVADKFRRQGFAL